MESNFENKVLGSLDVIALEVTALRVDVTELRSDVTELRSDVTELRTDLAAFRTETSQNFNRIDRRLDNHEMRIETLASLPRDP